MIPTTSFIVAQENKSNITLQYTTEGQSNWKGRFNWVNLLDCQISITTESLGAWQNGYLNAQFISIHKISEERIINDLQVFSNIEEANLPLGIFSIGYTHRLNRAELFGGLRNVNGDYFTEPYSSFFTNSSCGIYPTLSANFPMANYPLSAMCLHLEYQFKEHVLIKNSLYNGVASEYPDDYKRIFRVSPAKDGLFSMTQFSYTHQNNHHGTYHIGVATHFLLVHRKEGYNGKEKKEKMNYSFWGNIEQCIYKDKHNELGILVQMGYAPPNRNDCLAYVGTGFVASGLLSKDQKDQLGLIVNRAFYTSNSETAIELGFGYQLREALHAQPTLHYIITGTKHSRIGLFRVTYFLRK